MNRKYLYQFLSSVSIFSSCMSFAAGPKATCFVSRNEKSTSTSSSALDEVEKSTSTSTSISALYEVENQSNIIALGQAIQHNHIDEINRLLILLPGIKLDLLEVEGVPALHYAVSKGYLQLVSLLIRAGASVNLEDRYGWTSMHYAVEKKHSGIAWFLVRAGAHPAIKSMKRSESRKF